MKLSKEVIEVLKNFSVINNSISISELGCIKTISQAGNILGIYTLEDFEFPVPFAIWDLSMFLSVVNLFDLSCTDFDFKEKYVIIKSNSNKIKYAYTDPNLIRNVNKIKPSEVYKKFDAFNCKIHIDQEDIKRIRKASNIMDLNQLYINASDECLVTLKDSEGASANTFDLEIDDFSAPGEITVNVENLEIINGSYDINIADNKVIKFSNIDIDLFYFITAKVV